MVKLQKVSKAWMECQACSSKDEVYFVEVGHGGRTSEIKLCKNCRAILSDKLEEVQEVKAGSDDGMTPYTILLSKKESKWFLNFYKTVEDGIKTAIREKISGTMHSSKPEIEDYMNQDDSLERLVKEINIVMKDFAKISSSLSKSFIDGLELMKRLEIKQVRQVVQERCKKVTREEYKKVSNFLTECTRLEQFLTQEGKVSEYNVDKFLKSKKDIEEFMLRVDV